MGLPDQILILQMINSVRRCSRGERFETSLRIDPVIDAVENVSRPPHADRRLRGISRVAQQMHKTRIRKDRRDPVEMAMDVDGQPLSGRSELPDEVTDLIFVGKAGGKFQLTADEDAVA